jgi:NodT family efflux transporter outer membrane factor (OMF) lipoprotein
MMKSIRLLPLFSALVLAGCAVGPDYVRPTVQAPAAFKEAPGNWKLAEPQDLAPRGNWWEAFGDPVLNGLEAQVNISNQTLKQAEAQYRQAQALAQQAGAAFYPTVGVSTAATRSRSHGTGAGTGGTIADNYSLTLNASWEPDIWGRVRRSAEAGNASAEASAADLAAARLSTQATLAQDYFALRVADAQKELLAKSVAAYEKSRQIAQNRYNAGVATPADVAQAETQLKSTQAQLVDLDVQRSQLEHAIAVLTGKPPAEFSLAPAAFQPQQPAIPGALPSQLLERRPDIAAAERRAAAANAQIGVARAAWFPSLSLGGSAGYAGASFAHLISAPNLIWSVGPALAETLFDGGLRSAQNKQAEAAYDAAVANYRQTVLTAFQDVEDNLAALRVLAQELELQNQAVAAAQRAEQLAFNQYKAGTADYLNVVSTQTAALSNQRSALQLAGRQYSASVLLIKALGGGWSAPAAR